MVFRTACAVAALAAWTSAAQTPRPAATAAGGRQPTETRHLTLRTSTSAPAAAPGSAITLYVQIDPKPKMHVYAPEQKDYIPVELTLTTAPAFTAQPARYPKAEKYFFAPLKETQLVFSKSFRIAQPITLAAGLTDAAVTINGTLRYQACDDVICYLPQDVAVSWTVGIKK